MMKDVPAAGSGFFPPDVHETGVDLSALPVIRVPDVPAVFAAADVLLRSGGFGLIVADLGNPSNVASTSLARLAGLARRYHTALLFLTRLPVTPARRSTKSVSWKATLHGATGSLGSLVSLHAHGRRRRIGPGQFQCELAVLKDKQRGPIWQYTEFCRGAMGLC
jgi:recombination protein RecA